MAEPTMLEFDVLPSLAPSFLRGAFARKRPADVRELPRLEAAVRGVAIDPARLAAYRRACGFRREGTLPPTYPQVLASPLHAALMAHPQFPFAMLGLVHVRSDLRSFRPLGDSEPLDFSVRVEGPREARAGLEFDLVTEARVAGELAWSSVTSVLSRRKEGASRGAPREAKTREPAGEPPGALRSVLWGIPEDLGRRYAGVSGDYNPIHLHALSAKAFGFPRAIAHGMWTLARCVAELSDVVPAPPRVQASFRKPVLLPSRVLFNAHRVDGGFSFAIRTRDGSGAHLTGTLEER